MADLCYCGIWVQQSRNNLVDFSHSFLQRCVTFLVPRPRIISYKWYSIFLGFSRYIWVSLLLIMILLFIVLLTLMKISNHYIRHHSEPIESQKIIMGILRIMTTADSIPLYTTPGLMIIFMCWSLFCLFITNFYSCDLVSFLTIPRYTQRIDSADEFVRNNLTWELHKEPNFDFLNMDLESNQIIKRSFVVDENVNTRIKHILSRKYALFVHRINNQVVMIEAHDLDSNTTPIHTLRIMQSCIYTPYIAFGFRHSSPYKEAMERKLRTLFESGIIHFITEREIRRHYASHWDSVSKEMDFKDSNIPEALRVEHIYGAFIVLLCGHSISIMIFLMEKVLSKSLKRKLNCFLKDQ